MCSVLVMAGTSPQMIPAWSKETSIPGPLMPHVDSLPSRLAQLVTTVAPLLEILAMNGEPSLISPPGTKTSPGVNPAVLPGGAMANTLPSPAEMPDSVAKGTVVPSALRILNTVDGFGPELTWVEMSMAFRDGSYSMPAGASAVATATCWRAMGPRVVGAG